ncbi:MAG: RNA polymerase sigma factor [Ruminococcus sp.]|nr:RNA polymerase sigma factor [Ruminococcus sp.]
MKELDEIYEKYAGKIYLYILKLCGNESIAEEIMQNTFLKAIENADSFEGRCEVTTWLCRIAKNEYLNFIKRRDNNNLTLEDERVDADGDIMIHLENKEAAVSVHKALHALAEPYREVFTLRVMGELSFRQIGEIFDKNENWARVTFFRGKAKLIDKLKEDGYEL